MSGGAPTLGSVFTERLVVGVGDLAVSNNTNAIISTYALGSCIGIVVFDKQANAGGMLHIMLPDSALTPDKARSQPAMFADTGIAAFFKAMASLKGQPQRMTVMVAGGASVLGGTDVFKIGERNIEAVRKHLRGLGVKVRHVEVGGFSNRTLHFNLKTGVVDMKMPTGTTQFPL